MAMAERRWTGVEGLLSAMQHIVDVNHVSKDLAILACHL